MNNVIYIDTSNSQKILVALHRKGKIDRLSVNIQRGEMSDKLLLNIKKVLNKNNEKLKNIDAIVVYRGPGPYTSLRVGISTANAIAYVLNIPIIGIKGDETFLEKVKNIKLVNNKKKSFSKPIQAYYQQAL
jgi:tRNA threonylcarbamoyl adenosine modification protein YeaZ